MVREFGRVVPSLEFLLAVVRPLGMDTQEMNGERGVSPPSSSCKKGVLCQ